jgi:hypothetical protein
LVTLHTSPNCVFFQLLSARYVRNQWSGLFHLRNMILEARISVRTFQIEFDSSTTNSSFRRVMAPFERRRCSRRTISITRLRHVLLKEGKSDRRSDEARAEFELTKRAGSPSKSSRCVAYRTNDRPRPPSPLLARSALRRRLTKEPSAASPTRSEWRLSAPRSAPLSAAVPQESPRRCRAPAASAGAAG